MVEFRGLQLDPRCVKCNRLPTAEITLYEMQNHLYICNICAQEAEQQGKRIAWVSGLQMEPPMTAPSATAQSGPSARTRTLSRTSNLPADSIFAILDVPLNIPVSEIEAAIGQKLSSLIPQPNSPEKQRTLELLHEWHEKLEDSEAFEEYRNGLKPKGTPLSVGGRSVHSAEEFLNACEASSEGWADGERILRRGQLEPWILYQLGNRNLATEARRCQEWTAVSNFRALNEMLYSLVPARPFRFYSEDRWQPLEKSVPKASTAEELVVQCDIHWCIAERHLYAGSMVFWLEQSQGIKGLNAYYQTAVAGYAEAGIDRGVGLELLLERAVPALPKPNLMVDFDKSVGQYTLGPWDRELEHQPIAVTVTNTTRGFTSIALTLVPPVVTTEPEWIALYPSPLITRSGRPGAGMPIRLEIRLMNLSRLARGRHYGCKLYIIERHESGQTRVVGEYPITLKTMWFFQGLRGHLWRWGLRGDIAGLAWNFAAGFLLALLPFLIIPALVPASYLHQPADIVTAGSLLRVSVADLVEALQFLGLKFPLLVGAILGFAGFWVGIGKGHLDYNEQRNSASFRKGTFWLSLLFAIALVFWNGSSEAIRQAFQYGGSVALGLLTFIIACIVALIRRRLETYLRIRYKTLLNPLGRAWTYDIGR